MLPNPQALQVLLDKQEIHDVLLRYCRAADRRDPELLQSVYHPDARDEHGFFRGTGKEMAQRMRTPPHPDQPNAFRSTMHFLGNVLIEVTDDSAHSEAYFVAFHRFDREGTDFDWTIAGRYVDRFERRSGEWKIAHRQVVYDWSRCDAVTSHWYEGNPADRLMWGQRNQNDYVYR